MLLVDYDENDQLVILNHRARLERGFYTEVLGVRIVTHLVVPLAFLHVVCDVLCLLFTMCLRCFRFQSPCSKLPRGDDVDFACQAMVQLRTEMAVLSKFRVTARYTMCTYKRSKETPSSLSIFDLLLNLSRCFRYKYAVSPALRQPSTISPVPKSFLIRDQAHKENQLPKDDVLFR